MKGDTLASGGRSAVFPACNKGVTQEQWDAIFNPEAHKDSGVAREPDKKLKQKTSNIWRKSLGDPSR